MVVPGPALEVEGEQQYRRSWVGPKAIADHCSTLPAFICVMHYIHLLLLLWLPITVLYQLCTYTYFLQSFWIVLQLSN